MLSPEELRKRQIQTILMNEKNGGGWPPFVRDNLVLYVPFWSVDKQAASFTSKGSSQHTVTVTGATWGSQGRVFDGDDLIEVTNNAVFGFTNNFSIEVWFKAVAPADYPYIIARGIFGSAKHGWGIRVEAGATNLQFHVCDGTSLYATASIAFTSDTWTHVVCTFARPTGLVYVNGVVSANTLTADAVIDNYNDEITIFRNIERTTFLTGSMGEVRLYSDVLTPAEVTNNYTVTKWRY